MNNISKFCKFVNYKIGFFAEQIIWDLTSGKAEELHDSFWWPYFNSFSAIRNVLKEYELWNTEEDVNNVQNY